MARVLKAYEQKVTSLQANLDEIANENKILKRKLCN